MKTYRSVRIAFVLLALVAAISSSVSQPLSPSIINDDIGAHPLFSVSTDADQYWDSRFGMAGVNDGQIKAIAADNEWIYIGGTFTRAGTMTVGHLLRINRHTRAMEPLGTEFLNGVDGQVLALAVLGDSVFVGGQFIQAGDVVSRNIAVWNSRTEQWSAVGEGAVGGVYSYVAALTIDRGNLYVGGQFTSVGSAIAYNIARWDGSEWYRFGSGTNAPVLAVAAHDGTVYAGGTFTRAGETPARYIAVWKGDAWQPLAEGSRGSVRVLAIHGGICYAVGSFYTEGADSISMLARWDDAAQRWVSLGKVTGPRIDALYSSGDSLFVGGYFTAPGSLDNLAIWNGSAWVAPSPHPYGYTTIAALTSSGGELWMGYGNYLGRLSLMSGELLPMGESVDGVVNAFAVMGGKVYAGGNFMMAGHSTAIRFAAWDTQEWESLSARVSGRSSGSAVISAIMPGAGGLYIGGQFQRAGDLIVENPVDTGSDAMNLNIVWWGGGEWKQMGAVPERVLAIAMDGDVPLIGTMQWGFKSRLCRWNDTGWVTLGKFDGDVRGIALDDNHNIYAVGNFKHVDVTNAAGIARLSITTGHWESLGKGVDGEANAIVIHDNRLYVGGRFNYAGGVEVSNIAAYDLTTGEWSPLDRGVEYNSPSTPGYVKTMTMNHGHLYVGGWFNSAGMITANNVAIWDGEAWSTFGSGVDGVVNAIAVDGDDMYVGGNFRTAGGTIPSWYFAHWNAIQLSVSESHVDNKEQSVSVVPNPVSGITQLRYTLSSAGFIRLTINDLLGREVTVVREGSAYAGEHTTAFDTYGLPAGIYYCRLQSDGGTVSTRLAVVR